MPRAIDRLIAALTQAYPDVTADYQRAQQPEDDDGVWVVRHPSALSDVQVETNGGELPFYVESDFSPPTLARTVEDALPLVIARLGVTIVAG